MSKEATGIKAEAHAAKKRTTELRDAELEAARGGSDEQKKRSLHTYTAKPSSDNDETR